MRELAYLDELSRMQARINSLFDRLLAGAGLEAGEPEATAAWAPEIDVLETAEAYLVFADLPGLDRDEIDLRVQQRRLEISGRRQPRQGESRFLRMERNQGPFQRVVRLDDEVDEGAIAARLRRGVLEITVPRRRAPEKTDVGPEGG